SPRITTRHAERGSGRSGPALSRVRWVVWAGSSGLDMAARAMAFQCTRRRRRAAFRYHARRDGPTGGPMTNPQDHDPDRTQLLHTQAPGLVPARDSDLPRGTSLGRYRIDSLLGRGGMGEVYRAEQLEPVRRTVALKLLRGQAFDARRKAHFEIERQVLAQMRHPAIAQIHDADTTPDGHPFFAMEFIDGQPITAFCDARGLPLAE